MWPIILQDASTYEGHVLFLSIFQSYKTAVFCSNTKMLCLSHLKNEYGTKKSLSACLTSSVCHRTSDGSVENNF